jgi:hypothetical protein
VTLPIDHFLNTDMIAGLRKRLKSGAPGGTRTPNLQLRRLALYPIELRALQHSV